MPAYKRETYYISPSEYSSNMSNVMSIMVDHGLATYSVDASKVEHTPVITRVLFSIQPLLRRLLWTLASFVQELSAMK